MEWENGVSVEIVVGVGSIGIRMQLIKNSRMSAID
jgi:hypothetical protein